MKQAAEDLIAEIMERIATLEYSVSAARRSCGCINLASELGIYGQSECCNSREGTPVLR